MDRSKTKQEPDDLPKLPPAISKAIRIQVAMLRGKVHRFTLLDREEELQQEAWAAWLEARNWGLNTAQATRHAVREVCRFAKRERDYYSRNITGRLDIDDDANNEYGDWTFHPARHDHPPVEKVIADLVLPDDRHRLILHWIGQGRTKTEVAHTLGVSASALNKIIRKNRILWFPNDAPKSVTGRGAVSPDRRRRGPKRNRSA